MTTPRSWTYTAPSGAGLGGGRFSSSLPSPSLTWAAPDTATEGVAITGTITASGSASGPWSLNVPSGWTISPSSGSSVVPGSPVSVSITGTNGTQDLTLTCSGATITGNPQTVVVSGAGSGLTVGAQVTSLQATSLSGSGARPYSATVMPLRGVVPSGSTLTTADGAARAAILSTHDDGSAAVVVLAGSASGTGSIAVHVATGSDSAALTASAISALVSSVSVAFGSPYGTASITDFSTPERVWWASSTTICARYRVAAPTPGSTALEAVIDIHAWAGRALVEVVVENCRMTTASPTAPAAASYSGAVVSVNGSTIATVNGNGAPEGNHAPLRAWYAAGWVGGDPGLRVTQLHTDLQAHPLLYRTAAASTADMSVYASDAYTPWTAGRHRATGMGGTGDHPSIGPLPQWEARALQSGDYRAWQATEVSALAVLGFGINYRDSGTGLVPTFTQLAGKNMQGGSWPGGGYENADLGWEVAHHPAAGLMAFAARPSPVFIDLAQKVAVWNGMWSTAYGSTPGTPTPGVFGAPYQVRGRAWGMRSLTHATFVTPDALAWKASGKASLSANVSYMDTWRTDAKYVLGAMCDESPAVPQDHQAEAGFQQPLWGHHYLAVELHKAASARLLTGAEQAAMNTLADWACAQPVRWVNEQTNGGWRYIPYTVTIGANNGNGDPGSQSTYGTERNRAGNHSDTPAASGSWMGYGPASGPYASYTADGSLSATYPSYFWSALVAAVERGVSGASTAWSTVQAGITNLASWLGGAATEPRWGVTPRTGIGWGSGVATGSYDGTSATWTPARDTDGRINAASWALVPNNAAQWVQVAGTRMDVLDSVVKSAVPGWTDRGGESWIGVLQDWNGMACDFRFGQERTIHAVGGGHYGSSNDGIYTFDLRKMQWAVELLPSDPQYWDSGYNGYSTGSFTNYTLAAAYQAANPTNVLGVYMDEFFDPANPSDPLRSSRRPTSRHTYGSQVFVSELGSAGKLLMGCRRYWEYDFASKTWALPKLPFGTAPGSFDGSTGYTGENMEAWWNAAESRYYVCATQNYGSSQAWSVQPGGANWRWEGYMPTGGYEAFATAQEVIGNTIWTLHFHDGGSGGFGRPWRMVETDMTTRAQVNHAVTLGASLSSLSWPKNDWDGQGMCWVPTVGKWLVLVYHASIGQVWSWLDPATWTIDVAGIAGAPGGDYRLQNKVRWVSGIGAVLWITHADQNVRLLKP